MAAKKNNNIVKVNSAFVAAKNLLQGQLNSNRAILVESNIMSNTYTNTSGRQVTCVEHCAMLLNHKLPKQPSYLNTSIFERAYWVANTF